MKNLFLILTFSLFCINVVESQTVEVLFEMNRDGTEVQKKLNQLNSNTLKASQKAFLKKIVEDQKKSKHYFKFIVSNQKSSYLYQTSDVPEGSSARFSSFDYYKDFNKNVYMMISSRTKSDEKIEEKLLTHSDWQIDNSSQQTICGFPTIKAIHKKENIIAWFSLKIPISDGPENYSGLPGMILQMEFLDQGKTIKAKEIKQKQSNTSIDLPNRKKVISLEKMKKKN